MNCIPPVVNAVASQKQALINRALVVLLPLIPCADTATDRSLSKFGYSVCSNFACKIVRERRRSRLSEAVIFPIASANMSDSDRRTESDRKREDCETPSPDTAVRDEEGPESQQEPINLYIRGVAPQATDREVEEAFGQFGKTVSCSVVRDPYSRECRGFAFVKMATLKSAEAAMNVREGITVCGRQLNVERARRNGPHPKTPGQYLGVDRSVREKFGGIKRRFDDRGGPDYGRDPYARRHNGYEDDRFHSRRRMSPPRRPYSPDRGYGGRGQGRAYFEPRGSYGRDRRFENHSPFNDDQASRRPGAHEPQRRAGPPPAQSFREGETERREGPSQSNGFRRNEIAASGRDDFGRDRP